MGLLATVERLRSYLRMDEAELPDEVAEVHLSGASGAVRGVCGWKLDEEATTMQAVASGGTAIVLPTKQLTSVEGLRVDGQVIDPARYRPHRVGVIALVEPYVFPSGWTLVEVDCTHGYSPVPGAVEGLVLELAARSVSNPDRVKQRIVGAVQEAYGEPGLTDADLAVLAPYALGETP